ncbi:MAG: dihydropteroate synthase [Muribaculaceae bacterium]|nr:dihydropteroate synthase [Muribaculaceae bacterium]
MRPTITIRGKLYSFDTPKVMGIVNATPDSFFSESRTPDYLSIKKRIEKMINEGVDILDLGGCSTRPGAPEISAEEEYERLLPALDVARSLAPEIPVSIDTFRASVARKCVEEWKADIINDISGGTLDHAMAETIAELKVPYILMHLRGTPADMQTHTDYEDVVADVLKDLAFKIADLRQLGVADVIVDPGFGFAKTTEQNFRLLDCLEGFRHLECPILVGISRKTMIWKTLGCTPAEALNGTTVLNTTAILKGADILRVHDVAEARQCVALTNCLKD